MRFTLLLVTSLLPLALFALAPQPHRVLRATLREWSPSGAEIHPGWERDLELLANEKNEPVEIVFGEETDRVVSPHHGISSYVANRFAIMRQEPPSAGGIHYTAVEIEGTSGRKPRTLTLEASRGKWRMTLGEPGGAIRFFSVDLLAD